MHFAGDRMMTLLLSEVTRSGVEEFVISRDMELLAITPAKSLYEKLNLVPRMFRLGKKDTVWRARKAMNDLMSDTEIVHIYGERTFRDALSFRLRRFFEETGADKLRIIPHKYEVFAG